MTTPKGDNAYERFQAVLALDAANETALEGIADIASRYLELFEAAQKSGDPERAKKYQDLANQVDPRLAE